MVVTKNLSKKPSIGVKPVKSTKMTANKVTKSTVLKKSNQRVDGDTLQNMIETKKKSTANGKKAAPIDLKENLKSKMKRSAACYDLHSLLTGTESDKSVERPTKKMRIAKDSVNTEHKPLVLIDKKAKGENTLHKKKATTIEMTESKPKATNKDTDIKFVKKSKKESLSILTNDKESTKKTKLAKTMKETKDKLFSSKTDKKQKRLRVLMEPRALDQTSEESFKMTDVRKSKNVEPLPTLKVLKNVRKTKVSTIQPEVSLNTEKSLPLTKTKTMKKKTGLKSNNCELPSNTEQCPPMTMTKTMKKKTGVKSDIFELPSNTEQCPSMTKMKTMKRKNEVKPDNCEVTSNTEQCPPMAKTKTMKKTNELKVDKCEVSSNTEQCPSMTKTKTMKKTNEVKPVTDSKVNETNSKIKRKVSKLQAEVEKSEKDDKSKQKVKLPFKMKSKVTPFSAGGKTNQTKSVKKLAKNIDKTKQITISRKGTGKIVKAKNKMGKFTKNVNRQMLQSAIDDQLLSVVQTEKMKADTLCVEEVSKKDSEEKPIDTAEAQVEESKRLEVISSETDLKTNDNNSQFNNKFMTDVITLENLTKIVEALKKLAGEEVSSRKKSIFNDYRYMLDVNCFKIANCPKRMVKLKLKHSLVDREHDDVVMIVKDLKRGAKVDYEPTINHYKDIFRELNLGFLHVLPFGQLRREYTTFECRRKLASTYDYFLCDGRLVGHATGICGQPFQRARTTLQPVRMGEDSSTWKAAIERALLRTSYRQLCKGTLTSIPVASFRHSAEEVATNILHVVHQLKNIYPGGWPNIRGMYLKVDLLGTSSIPIYVSLLGPPAKVPEVIGLKEKRMQKLRKNANPSLSKIVINKSGKVIKLNRTQLRTRQEFMETTAALLKEKAADMQKEPLIVSDEPCEKKEETTNTDEKKVPETH